MTVLQALRADPLLAQFAAAGILTPADVHVAMRLGRLTGETDERVRLAVALTVRGTREGSVVLDLRQAATTTAVSDEIEVADDAPDLQWPPVEEWIALCAASPLFRDDGSAAPMRMVDSRLWLDRYWRQESLVAAQLLSRSARTPDDLDFSLLDQHLESLFPADVDSDQRAAASTAARAQVSVIGGGPGTGKTTTIARLVAVLHRQRPRVRVALAAPTGKAAARLEEAVHAAEGTLTADDREWLATLSARTLHRLLGNRPGVRSRFRHDRDNRLPYDVVVVDECSMVSVTLMARLLDALPAHARLVLVGDPDQLASVEAGAVLGDLVEAGREVEVLRDSLTTLRTVHRFDAGGPIAALAQCVRDGRADDALAMLRGGDQEIAFHSVEDDEPISGEALATLRTQTEYEIAVIAAARVGDVDGALSALERHRILCAHRAGPRGVRHWSDTVERWLIAQDPSITPRLDGYYPGQPLLVTTNDYENGLYNGDTGVVVDVGDGLFAAFRRGAAPVMIPLVRLSDVRPLHVMTVHRAQGSQFREVTVVMPTVDSPLATRQTFYTAITRASEKVRVIGSAEAVRACVNRPAARASGLRDRLAGRLASPIA